MKARLAVLSIALVLPLSAQSVFSSGSDGSDGDLIYTAPTDGSTLTVTFDPNDKTQFPNGVDKGHNNVFNFGTITIPAHVHVIMRADKLGGPVYFLAQNNVTIGGWLDLNGNDGATGGTVAQTSAVPGPGGFYGGIGGDTASRPPSAGFGPAGGAAANPKLSSCDEWAKGGGYTANSYLVPLIGGSGGGGYVAGFPSIGNGGGAGGGAILIASSGTITISSGGSVTAHGGNSAGGAGTGAGGSIRLVANTLQGSGTLSIGTYNQGCSSQGSSGEVRLEAFQQLFTGSIDGTELSASPFNTFAPTTTSPIISVVSVAGVAVNVNPSGSFQMPDVTINNSGSVPIVIQTNNVPVGTVIQLQIFPENGTSQTIQFPALTSSGLNVRTTANATFQSGFSRGFVQASFTVTQ